MPNDRCHWEASRQYLACVQHFPSVNASEKTINGVKTCWTGIQAKLGVWGKVPGCHYRWSAELRFADSRFDGRGILWISYDRICNQHSIFIAENRWLARQISMRSALI